MRFLAVAYLLSSVLLLAHGAVGLPPDSVKPLHTPLPAGGVGVAWDGHVAYFLGGDYTLPEPERALRELSIQRLDPAHDRVEPVEARLPEPVFSPEIVWTGRVFLIYGGAQIVRTSTSTDAVAYTNLMRFDPSSESVSVVATDLPDFITGNAGRRGPFPFTLKMAWADGAAWGFLRDGTAVRLDESGVVTTTAGAIQANGVGYRTTAISGSLLATAAPNGTTRPGPDFIVDARTLRATIWRDAPVPVVANAVERDGDILALVAGNLTGHRQVWELRQMARNGTPTDQGVGGPVPRGLHPARAVPWNGTMLLFDTDLDCSSDSIVDLNPAPTPPTAPNQLPAGAPPYGTWSGFVGKARAQYDLQVCHIQDPDGIVVDAEVDWGDGTSSRESMGLGLSHTYSTAGDFAVDVRVLDDRGGVASWQIQTRVLKCSSDSWYAAGPGFLTWAETCPSVSAPSGTSGQQTPTRPAGSPGLSLVVGLLIAALWRQSSFRTY